MLSPYHEENLAEKIREVGHRGFVGGLWEELGALQFEFLRGQGLRPEHRLMDVGCGSLRLGCLLVDYLEPERYFGIDLIEELLDAGHANELDDAQRARLPRSHLHATGAFEFGFLGQHRIDVAFAQSVFTHLPLNDLRDCLTKLAHWMAPGGVFFSTFFLCPEDVDLSEPLVQPIAAGSGPEITTFATRDPYHYWLSDLEFCAARTKWQVREIGDWGHPRNQRMVAFELGG